MYLPPKVCKRCSIEKPLEEFNKRRGGRRYAICRECKNIETREAAQTNRWPSQTKEGQRAYRLKRNYGITKQQFDDLVFHQNGACALCGENDVTKMNISGGHVDGLVVDHDHETGCVRGLLCGSCNIWLGNYEELMKRAGSDKLSSYLLPNDSWIAPAIYNTGENNESKICRGCGIRKSLGQFTMADKAYGYRKAQCYTCESARVKEYYYRRKSLGVVSNMKELEQAISEIEL